VYLRPIIEVKGGEMAGQGNEKGSVYKHSDVTEKILAAFYKVYNTLGYGFLEKVYENALAIELRNMGLRVVQQEPITVFYDGEVVGEYFADLTVEACVLVEIKAARELVAEHEAQLLNYLKATPYEVGQLLNFGPKPQHIRRAFDNTRKEWMTEGDADQRR
jgi:GxxExxY protein